MSSAVEGWQRRALLGVRQWRLSAIALGFAREREKRVVGERMRVCQVSMLLEGRRTRCDAQGNEREKGGGQGTLNGATQTCKAAAQHRVCG